mmetsp:Transcript_12426/g.35335  ORF Transcript_12426/g.35335 Transcript_12426/m.35335 type:complete len:520 (+) Transcript_12426:122-1681(+)|eukprot:CAMPEP_0172380006 /NCGR_PEP_ID=MMETSP1060-20121228/70215_1 /TAXON_ID=37318 /ORGANISM="Pseudo-nitzschia pungens, Strain cf. cingulata" /LENGTH=519 /DNA_ID=CAMNT_0013107751 /DNA_START=63 /DNA_END=1623 /DNA_ORIENTATION=+
MSSSYCDDESKTGVSDVVGEIDCQSESDDQCVKHGDGFGDDEPDLVDMDEGGNGRGDVENDSGRGEIAADSKKPDSSKWEEGWSLDQAMDAKKHGNYEFPSSRTLKSATLTDLDNTDHSQFSEGKDCEVAKGSIPRVETWELLTRRDRKLSKTDLVHVVDHSMAILGERICEATNNKNFRESLKTFDRNTRRFRNSEIVLGRRIANGSFADIFKVESFRPRDDAADDYQIEEETEDVKRDRPDDYVVKVLRSNLLSNTSRFATGASDFLTEGILLASVDHPHILAIRGRSVTSVEGFLHGKRDSLFFILERMDGTLAHKMVEWHARTYEHRLFTNGRRDSKLAILHERLVAMADLASALAYLHERRLIHRDVSLGNVGISYRAGKVKLLDFGLAKVLPPSDDENQRFLLTGTTGSIRYMATEIALKQPYNLKADVYSFAMLLYEVLCLEKVFSKWHTAEIFEQVHNKQHRPRMSMFWSKQIKQLLKSCWAYDPVARLQMKEVEVVLRKEIAGLQTVDSV